MSPAATLLSFVASETTSKDREVAASHHGDTPYSGNSVTSVLVTPYTTSVDVNLGVSWNGSWNGSPDNPTAASAISAIIGAIRAASASIARDREPFPS
jgi:hypothetical protein